MAKRDDSTILVRRVVIGDEAGLHRVIARFTPLLMVAARHRLHRHLREVYPAERLVEDVWQMALPQLVLLRARAGRETSVLLRFLSGVLVDRYGMLLQRRAHGRSLEGADAAAMPGSVAEVVRQAMHGAEVDALGECLAQLDERDREVIVLCAIEQASDAEAAAAMGAEARRVAEDYRRVLGELQRRLPGSALVELVAAAGRDRES